jgi:hypothetical protein
MLLENPLFFENIFVVKFLSWKVSDQVFENNVDFIVSHSQLMDYLLFRRGGFHRHSLLVENLRFSSKRLAKVAKHFRHSSRFLSKVGNENGVDNLTPTLFSGELQNIVDCAVGGNYVLRAI